MRHPATPALRLALLTPDRPHNLGAVMRTCACFGVGLEIVEPAAFPLDDRRIREGALDYWRRLVWARHASIERFLDWTATSGRRLVVLTVQADMLFHQARYRPDDVLVLGSERSGVPERVHATADLRLRIPMFTGARSLNVATAAAIALAEALRQTDGFAEGAGGGE